MEHGASLKLDRCPHCNVAKPNLSAGPALETKNDRGGSRRYWRMYQCATCGGVVMAVAPYGHNAHRDKIFEITDIWPAPQHVDEAVPARAREFLAQAIASLHAPSGAVMLTASAVDSMLKEKGLKEGSLYKRIDAAADAHLITAEMAVWAHEVRLEANDQRHADEEAAMPSEVDAAKVIEFATALAQFLFVLPARVARGRGE